jgi:GR25 family glycosyltransferase involved in LPS biosynthesis
MNHIDTIYYINLDHRTDRNTQFLNCMNDLQIPKEKIQRITAIYDPELGALGCTKSHIIALETFIKSNNKLCIIFEDDFIYKNKETFITDISKIFETNIPFDIVQLSYNNIYMPELYYQVSDTEYSFLKKVNKTICASSYIITREFASKLIENFKESADLLSKYGYANNKAYVLDVYWHSLQSKANWYIFYPSIGFQRPSYSDICQNFQDYGI